MIGRADPDVSVAMTEFMLMKELGLRSWELDGMPANQVSLYLAIAEMLGEQRERERQRAALSGRS